MTEIVYIVLRDDLRVGKRQFLPGDRFPMDQFLAKAVFTDFQLECLKEQKYYAPVTRESFAICMARRPAGSPAIPQGFEEAELRTLGVWAEPPAPAVVTPVKKKHTPRIARNPTVYVDVEHAGFTIHPILRANSSLPPTWDVLKPDGSKVRDKAFGKLDKAKAFIDSLGTSTAGAVTGNSEAAPAKDEEPSDGGDLRSVTG